MKILPWQKPSKRAEEAQQKQEEKLDLAVEENSNALDKLLQATLDGLIPEDTPKKKVGQK